MTPETPLPEVAHLLGQETAAMILDEKLGVQMAILSGVRTYVVEIEKTAILDPIELQARIRRFVDGFLFAYREDRHD